MVEKQVRLSFEARMLIKLHLNEFFIIRGFYLLYSQVVNLLLLARVTVYDFLALALNNRQKHEKKTFVSGVIRPFYNFTGP